MNWCNRCKLDLNVNKTKELVLDFRKNKTAITPLFIGNETVDIVESFKYLGVTFQCDLKWQSHVSMLIKKAYQRFYFVRCLHKCHIENEIICLFYNCVISSIMMYAISCWFPCCTDQCKNELFKVRNRACRIVGPLFADRLANPLVVCKDRCIKIAEKIIQDEDHPLNKYFIMLPHQRRYNMIYCRTARFRNTLIPTAIKLINNND